MTDIYYKNSRFAHAANGATQVTGRFLDFYEKVDILPATDDEPYVIPTEFANNISLLANLFYGNPRLGWVILNRNNIENPLVDLYAGRTIYKVSVTRLRSEILS